MMPYHNTSHKSTWASKPIPVKEEWLQLPASISWRDKELAALRRLTELELGMGI